MSGTFGVNTMIEP